MNVLNLIIIISFGLLIFIVFLTGCSKETNTFTTTTLTSSTTTTILSGLYCISDDDCVIKSVPYCRGETLEFIDDCYNINVEPPNYRDCSGINVFPESFPVKSCKCINNNCDNVYSEQR